MDDDPAICGVITEILAETDLSVVCVHRDLDAYAALATLPPFQDGTFDINLGTGTTGFDVARYARQAISGIRVIYVSGEASQTSFRSFGVPDSRFLLKPFNGNELLEALGIAPGVGQ